MSRLSMMEMDIAPVLAIAWFVTMGNALKYCDVLGRQANLKESLESKELAT
jgi:hypothetical protein